MINDESIKVEILLSTYNGENYLDQQLKSIINQTYANWILTIRDDGSKDSTVEIINRYIQLYPQKIMLRNDSKGNLGSSRSFELLLYASKERYILFCDQDDEWLPNKIKISLAKMQEIESMNKNIPILIFTDLIVVDESMNVINSSFWKNQKLSPKTVKNHIKLSALNVITGCTIILNKAAKKYILPFPNKDCLHDYWIGLNISYYGIVDYLPIPTVLYRQHNNNSIGAHKISFFYFYKKLKKGYLILKSYKLLFDQTRFKINFIKFLYYKLSFSVKRLF